LVLAFVSGRCLSCPGRSFGSIVPFFRFADGADSSAVTLAEGFTSPALEGVVVGVLVVVVQLLGIFLFLPSRVVSMSFTVRLKKTKPYKRSCKHSKI